MKQGIKELFSSIAPAYDRLNAILSLSLDKRWRRRMVASAECCTAPKILDLCAGTLACSMAALERFPDAKITALDFSRQMLDVGWDKLSEHQRRNMEVICADAMQQEFGPGAFDIVLCGWGMRNLLDVELAIEKIMSWLKPGGELIVIDLFRPTSAAARLFHATAGRCLIPMLGGMISKDKEAYKYLISSIQEFCSAKEFCSLLSEYGFQNVSHKSLALGAIALIKGSLAGGRYFVPEIQKR